MPPTTRGRRAARPTGRGCGRTVRLYRKIITEPAEHQYAGAWYQAPTPVEIRQALAGRDLACWCPLDQMCHGDVLLEIANGGEAT